MPSVEQVRVILFNFCDQFLYRIPLKVLLQTIINILPQVLVIHAINDAFDIRILQFVTIYDVVLCHEIVCDGNKKERAIAPSGEHITRLEIIGLIHILTVHTSHELANIPEKIFLEDAFASDAEFRAKCIQARLCGVGLPTAIKDCHGGVINHCNFVAVEIHSRNTVVSDNFSVTRTPVLVASDSGTHLLFDLTHGWCRLVDFYTIQEMGALTTPCVTLWSLVGKHALMGIAHVIYHVIRGRHVETIAEPVHCHLSIAHGIEHEVLQVLQGLGVGEKCFCHVDIIGTGSGDIRGRVDSLPTGAKRLTSC